MRIFFLKTGNGRHKKPQKKTLKLRVLHHGKEKVLKDGIRNSRIIEIGAEEGFLNITFH